MKGALLEIDTSAAAGPELSGTPSENGFGRKRLTINTLSSLAYFVLLMGVGLWYTPFMLHRVPEELYGLVPLATSLTSHMTVIMTMITGPVCRYVSAEFQRGDVELANSTLNSFVFGGLKLVALMAVVVVIFVAVLPVSVPRGHEMTARLLFFSIGFAFLISSMSSCFEVGYWITHRFEIKNLVEILVLLIRNGSVVILFALFQADIWQIAAAALLAAVVQLATTYSMWRHLAPGLRIDRHCQTPERKGLIYSVGRWLILVHVGNQLLMSTDLFLINRYFGTVDNTKYGIALLAATIIRSIFSSLGLILVPAMVTVEATQTKQDLVSATGRALRMFGSLAAHATGILAGLSLPVLTIWIKKPWVAEVAPLMTFTLFIVTLEVFVVPLTALLIDTGRIKRFAIGSVTAGVVALILAVILLETTNLHFYAIAIPFAIAAFLRHGLFNPILAANGLETSWYTFMQSVLPLLLRFAFTIAVARLVGDWLKPDGILPLLGCMVLAAVVVLPLSIAALPRDDRRVLLNFALPRIA